MSPTASVSPVTCLGCGCGCDDLTIGVSEGRIVSVEPPCPLARAWFGDGRIPGAITRAGRPSPLDAALADAAEALVAARGRALVVLAPEISTQAQRTAVAIADLLRATVDTATSDPAAVGLLAAQRRGRAASTLGEIRNRADVLLFWGVDPTPDYPRYLSRYALEPVGTHVPQGRAGRTVISASIGADRGPPGGDVAITLKPEDEIAALSVMRAVAMGRTLGDLPATLAPVTAAADRLVKARYAVVVHDAEPGTEPARDPYRAEGLIALTQALNGPTRAALSTLRAGGNRSGAEAVLTWQAGFPIAVSYRDGTPRYAPASRGLAWAVAGGAGAILVAGAAASLGDLLAEVTAKTPAVVVGPLASEAPFPTRVAIDTGMAGIHEGGTAYRMDDVPLPLRPPLEGPRSAAETLELLLGAVRARDAEERR